MPRVRAVVVREQYIIRRKPSPRPPQRGGGWLVACGVVGALIVIGKLAGGASPPVLPSASGRQVVIETSITTGNRCIVPGVSVNGRAQSDLLADSGAPDMWFPVGDLPKLGIARSSLNFSPFGAREGNVAWVTLETVRVGDFVARNVEAGIADGKEFHWRLLGMSVLKQGHVGSEGPSMRKCTLAYCTQCQGSG